MSNDRRYIYLLSGLLLGLLLSTLVLSAQGDGNTSPPELLTKTPPSCGTYPPTPCPYWEATPLPYQAYEPVLPDYYPAPNYP